MLSVFPSLLSFQSISPLIIRVTLSLIFLFWVFKNLTKPNFFQATTYTKAISLIEGIASLFILIGLFTQVGVAIIAIDLIVRLYTKFKNKALFSDGVNYYFVLLVLAISLLLTGPGFLAFDLPI